MGWYSILRIHNAITGEVQILELKYFCPKHLSTLTEARLTNSYGVLCGGSFDFVYDFGCQVVYYLVDSVNNIYLLCKGEEYLDFPEDLHTCNSDGKFLAFYSSEERRWYTVGKDFNVHSKALEASKHIFTKSTDELVQRILTGINSALTVPLLLQDDNALERSRREMYDRRVWRTVIKFLKNEKIEHLTS